MLLVWQWGFLHQDLLFLVPLMWSPSCSTCLLWATQNLTRWCCSQRAPNSLRPHGTARFASWMVQLNVYCVLQRRLLNRHTLFFEIFILKNESEILSVLTWASFTAAHVSCREFMQLCSMPSTLYGDPTSLKLCHREIKSCNDFQYIDMDNNCIG